MEDQIDISIDSFEEKADLESLVNNFSENNKNEGVNMNNNLSEVLNKTMETLSGISGFIAAGIYNGSGDILATNDKKSFKFEEIGTLAIELYKNAKSISDKMGLGICNFIETHTEKYIFVHMCIIPGKGAIGVLLSSDGNVGLTRHQMRSEGENLIPYFE